MMLRNRDLNVVKNGAGGVEASKAQQLQKGATVGGAVPGKITKPAGAQQQKRQAPHLVTRNSNNASSGGSTRAAAGGDDTTAPRPKRACSQSDKDAGHNKENINNHNGQNQNNILTRRNTNNNNENNAVAHPQQTVVPVSAFSRSLLIDSTKKGASGGSGNNNAAGAAAANKRVSAIGGAPLAGRKRSSALSVRDTNAEGGAGSGGAGAGQHHQRPKSSSQEAPQQHAKHSYDIRTTSSQKEEKENEQKMDISAVDLPSPKPVVVYNFDKENERDLSAVSQYAQDIFTYYKFRERFFRVSDYIGQAKHPQVTVEVRAKLMDWMVELQETFELNHETLYLGVKLVDMFMASTSTKVTSHQMQLIASAAVFIASKFDERAPPLIDDFIYMAEDSFDRDQLLEMERELLKVVEFDLGAPLSYRFLRRYARVSKLDMGTLTLARYVLETSLMFLDFCRVSESLIAAAALLLALRMKGVGDWGPILDKYTGYTRAEVEPLMWRLNRMVDERKKHYPHYDTVFRKYSHEIFFEVAKVKLLREQN